MKLSIVIPAHNEEHRLLPTLDAYTEYFDQRMGGEYEIIVVVNHCSDRTESIARNKAEASKELRVLVETEHIGKGGAVELGFREACGELIGFVDADGASPPDSFFKLVENIGEAGCIIASRWIKGACVNPPQSWIRRFASRVLNKLFVHGLFGLDINDSQCGAKLFRADVLKRILPEAVERGWAFDIELLCRVKRFGYGIREFPTEWHHIPGNPTTFVVMGLQMLASVWRVKKALNCRELSL